MPGTPSAKEKKAKMPRMYFAFDSCAKDKCDYLHDKNNLYKGPKPQGLRTAEGLQLWVGLRQGSDAIKMQGKLSGSNRFYSLRSVRLR